MDSRSCLAQTAAADGGMSSRRGLMSEARQSHPIRQPPHHRGLSLTPTGTVPQALPIAPNDFPASPLSFGDCPLAVKSLQAVVTCRLGRTVGLHRCPLWLSRAKGIRRCRPASLILSRVMSHLLPSDVAAPGRLRRFTAGGAIPWPASGCKRHRRLPRPCQAPYRPAAGHREPT